MDEVNHSKHSWYECGKCAYAWCNKYNAWDELVNYLVDLSDARRLEILLDMYREARKYDLETLEERFDSAT